MVGLAAVGAILVTGVVWPSSGWAAAKPRAKMPPQDKPLCELDRFVGDYGGTFTPPDGKAVKAFAKIALVRSKYHVQFFRQPGKDLPAEPTLTLPGKVEAKVLTFLAKQGDVEWSGRAADGSLAVSAQGRGGGRFEMKHVVRESPTAGARPPAGAIVLMPFEPGKKSSLAEWTNQAWKCLPDGSVEIGPGNNETRRKFKDFRLHLEFRLPCQPDRTGQGRGNSGVYVLGRYEVQILDSFGLPRANNGCGAIYRVAAGTVNASFPPLSWQTYDITFRAARYDPADKTRIAEYPRITVVHNGVTVHDRFELRDATGSRKRAGHVPSGPIHLQNHGNPVRFRNIWIMALQEGQRPDTEAGR